MTAEQRLAWDLANGPFLAGEDHGRWRLVQLDGVVAVVAVSAPPKPNAPNEYDLRLTCAGYPGTLPIGIFWDVALGAELDDNLWPRLAPPDQSFRTDWRPAGPGTTRSIYVVTDGYTMRWKAAQWLPMHQLEAWRPEVGIACYLEVVHARLNSPRYLGNGRTPISPAA